LPIILKDPNDLNTETLAFLQNSSQVTNISKGTVVAAITGAVNAVLAQSYDDLTSTVAETYISTASGTSLDFLGAMLGVPRGGSSLATRNNVQQFYVITGNFGSVPGIGALGNTIPGGTVVQTQDGSIQYQTVGDVHFNNTDTQVFATVRALVPGAASNVGINILTAHTLPVAGILTTNISAISDGTNTQTDTEYRFVLSKAVTAAEAGNEISIRLAALSVQGVSDVLIVPFFYGVGTYSIVVVGTTPIVADNTLTNVLGLVQQVTSLGEFVTVRPPRYIGVEIAAKLIFTKNTIESDKVLIMGQVTDALFDYINNIPLGQGLIRDQIIAKILNVSSEILDVDDDPTSTTNMQISIWSPTTTDIVNNIETTNRIKQALPLNYTAFFDDKLIVEQNVQGFQHAIGYSPINITAN